MASHIERRKFLATLGGATAAWPFAASAQQPSGLLTIGFLSPTTALVENQRVAAFVQRLRALGWIEGRTVAIKVRWAEGRSERTAEIVAEPVGQKVDIIVCWGSVSVFAAKQATSVIPIVFAEGDPVGTGFVVRLARTGGNVAGLSLQQTDLAGKRFQLLREVVPPLRRLAILGNAGNPVSLLDMREVEAAAGALGLTVFAVEIRRVEVLLPVWSGYVPFDPLLSTHQPDSHSATLGIPCGRTRILKLWHSRVHERIAQIFEHAIRSALNSRRSIWSLR